MGGLFSGGLIFGVAYYQNFMLLIYKHMADNEEFHDRQCLKFTKCIIIIIIQHMKNYRIKAYHKI